MAEKVAITVLTICYLDKMLVEVEAAPYTAMIYSADQVTDFIFF